jgi:hypothetical protein
VEKEMADAAGLFWCGLGEQVFVPLNPEASVRYHSGLNVSTAQTALLNAREAALTFYRAVVGRHIRIGMLLP